MPQRASRAGQRRLDFNDQRSTAKPCIKDFSIPNGSRILFLCLVVQRVMEGLWDRAVVWFFALGEQYGVDPIVFGSIYVGAIPLFALSVAWLIKAKRSQKSLTFPTISAGFWFISSYLYLFITGENIPWWIYAIVIVLLGYAGFASYRNIQSKLKHSEASR